jgi:hypothetical protein
MPSLGLTAAAIIGMKYGVPRLINGLVRDLFREDATPYYRDLLSFAVPELKTLESAYGWFERLGAKALSARELIDQLDQAGLANAFQDKLAQQDAEIAGIMKQINAERAAPPSRTKRGQQKSMKKRSRAK